MSQLYDAALSHYLPIYRAQDPQEIARRCRLPFDTRRSLFRLRLMGVTYEADHPDYDLRAASGEPRVLAKDPERILVLRYLCAGEFTESGGGQLAYDELPWGGVYLKNFRDRCLRRAARVLGDDLGGFRAFMTGCPALRAAETLQGDAGYRFEFMSNFFMSVILWQGDDEFPPAAQFLFDDNFPRAFTAEDAAVAGDTVIDRIRARKEEQ
ncbi:MAG: DUF3786 domain-containing protein [Gracilibacteraceae bacterium]|jgi:hypothetical protein|nr:DUF3786 domain-containing protein [Gracilibacteraceae bacterium]